jgi:hypothetical protein
MCGIITRSAGEVWASLSFATLDFKLIAESACRTIRLHCETRDLPGRSKKVPKSVSYSFWPSTLRPENFALSGPGANPLAVWKYMLRRSCYCNDSAEN